LVEAVAHAIGAGAAWYGTLYAARPEYVVPATVVVMAAVALLLEAVARPERGPAPEKEAAAGPPPPPLEAPPPREEAPAGMVQQAEATAAEAETASEEAPSSVVPRPPSTPSAPRLEEAAPPEQAAPCEEPEAAAPLVPEQPPPTEPEPPSPTVTPAGEREAAPTGADVDKAAEAPPTAAPPREAGREEAFLGRLRRGLAKTQAGLLGRIEQLIAAHKEIDDELWEEFEEALVMADLGVGTTMKLRERVEEKVSRKGLGDPARIRDALKEEVLDILRRAEGGAVKVKTRPTVILVAGVNGVGKTTTIGKIAHMFAGEGRKVMVAAADTFRAAAVEQLEIWAQRVGADFLRGQHGADPSGVAYDAVKAAQSRGVDVLIIDTAGRLHTKSNLMEELKKIRRVVGKAMEGAPHETLLVLDATTGQNALEQAKLFGGALDVTGIVLTKLDGTAKGGIIVPIADELGIPVKYVGVGEGLGDLRPFAAEEFVEALFATGDETLH